MKQSISFRISEGAYNKQRERRCADEVTAMIDTRFDADLAPMLAGVLNPDPLNSRRPK